MNEDNKNNIIKELMVLDKNKYTFTHWNKFKKDELIEYLKMYSSNDRFKMFGKIRDTYNKLQGNDDIKQFLLDYKQYLKPHHPDNLEEIWTSNVKFLIDRCENKNNSMAINLINEVNKQ